MLLYSLPLILLFFGLLPSFIWLSFYRHKDLHPEPRYLITRTFLMGITLAPLAVIAQWLFSNFLVALYPGLQVTQSSTFFLWAAFVEEVVKFLAVKILILNNPEFDEPVDAMIYMITAGLGFAAIENTLVVFQSIPNGLQLTIQLWLLRFVGATLLHAVAAGLMGYFLALSWFYHHHSKKLIGLGLAVATSIHFTFNLMLLNSAQISGIIYSVGLLAIVSSFISVLFKQLQHSY